MNFNDMPYRRVRYEDVENNLLSQHNHIFSNIYN